MLPSQYRLKKRKDFYLVNANGWSFASRTLITKYLKNNLPFSRFGFVIGTKISKKSSKRNKIKRWLREIIRLNLQNIESGLDVVLIARPPIIDSDYQKLREELNFILTKTKILK